MIAFGGRADFIRQNTRVLPTPHAPEISLHVADEATALWSKTEEELGELGLPPPFWAFAWAGGQGLARYILDHPDCVRGKRVLDLASGSGLVAIAAAKAGAARVEASEIDDFAIAAIEMNAGLNNVLVEPVARDVCGDDAGWDVVLAGDISYERDMATRLTDWLEELAKRGALVLIGDPGRSYLQRKKLVAVAEYRVAVNRSLEDMDIKRTNVWRFATEEDRVET